MYKVFFRPNISSKKSSFLFLILFFFFYLISHTQASGTLTHELGSSEHIGSILLKSLFLPQSETKGDSRSRKYRQGQSLELTLSPFQAPAPQILACGGCWALTCRLASFTQPLLRMSVPSRACFLSKESWSPPSCKSKPHQNTDV